MTPVELAAYARQKYNAVGDTFFSDAELYGHIYDAQMQLARETDCIRRVYTTSTVIGQQEYSAPTNTTKIKRITVDGRKLKPITMREDDAMTGDDQDTTSTGTPVSYYEWDTSIFLRPIPDSVVTMKIFSFNEPQEVSATSTLEVPTRYHLDMSLHVLSQMATKDRNYDGADRYAALWTAAKLEAKRYERKRLRGDGFSAVQDTESAWGLYDL